MSDEEKKAIKLLKDEIEKCKNLTTRNQPMSDIVYEIIKEKTAIKCVVNLVENQQREIEELKTKLEIEKINNKYNQEERDEETIPRYKIRERIKHNEEQRNNVVSVAKFKIDNDGITGEGIEGLNDLIVYKSYEAVINELNYLLKE